MRTVGMARWLILWALQGLCFSGCGESPTEPREPDLPTGAILGTVRSGGIPLDATVRATRVDLPDGDQSLFEFKVRPDGRYGLDVPMGRYVVGLRFGRSWDLTYTYSAMGVRFGGAPPDTLVVQSMYSPVSADFDLASLRVHVDLPADFDGEMGWVQLHRRPDATPLSPWSYRGSQSGTVENGSLDLTLAGVLPGSYRVEVLVGFTNEPFWIPGVRDSALSPWIEVPPDRSPEVRGRVGPEMARIQGRIIGAWLDMGLSSGPEVDLLTPDSTLVCRSGVGADGRFDAKTFFPGPVKLLVRQSGIDQWIGGRTFEDASVFQLEAGRTISGIEFVQSGMQVEIGGLYPRVEAAWFRLYDAATLAPAGASLAEPWYNLTVALPNLRPGTYRIYIEPYSFGSQWWAPQWFDRAYNSAGGATITIGREGEVVPISVVLEKGGTIAGVVREAEGVTGDYSLYLTRADDPAPSSRTYAWSLNLGFRFEGLPDGDWKVGASRLSPSNPYSDTPPPETVWFPGTTDWQAAGIIPIRNFGDVTSIDIVMPSPQP